jgi:hypothetical protein
MNTGDQHPADNKPENAEDGINPGFPPDPIPRYQQRQEGNDNYDKQQLDNNSWSDNLTMIAQLLLLSSLYFIFGDLELVLSGTLYSDIP